MVSTGRHLVRWIELAGCKKNLADLMMQEQFMNMCSPELALFLRERVPKDVGEMVAVAERYHEAHGTSMAL